MKHLKHLLAAALTMLMALAIATPALASTQTVTPTTPDVDNATITINNPAKGETYSVFKLFDATVSADGNIAYQCAGEIPSGLTAFFSKDASNNVIPADSILEKDGTGKVIGTKMTDDLKAALETWAASATASGSVESDGSDTIAFTGLPYGYYVMTTSHEDATAAKALITVDSTKPNASINDKNETKVIAKEKKIYTTGANGQLVPISSASIGDTVTFVAKFDTTNYVGSGEDAKQVFKYEIKDTLPEYLSDVAITSVTVDGTALNPTPAFTNKAFFIAWTNGQGDNLYKNGAEIVVTYTAKLTDVVNIDTANTNTISIQPYTDDNTPYDKPYETEAVLRTYAAAIKKTDQDHNKLAGAQFTIKGLTVTGSNGVYTVVSYNPASDAAESAVLDTDADGKLYIVGLGENVSLTVTEFKAPDGYNKLTQTKTLSPQVLTEAIYKESGTVYYDAKGNVVSQQSSAATTETVVKNLTDLDAQALEIQNQKGVQLPSTGGIGTTIFYVVGGALIITAGVLLVTKRRMASLEK